MTKSKKNNRPLILSIISITICLVLLIGATIAWFTDTETNKGNTINAGTLDIVAQWYNVDADSSNTEYTIGDYSFKFSSTANNFATTDDSMISETNWQSGDVNAKLVEVINNGTLDVNIDLAAVATDLGLEDALWFDFVGVSGGSIYGDFTVRAMSTLSDVVSDYSTTLTAGSSVQFILIYGMLESAGNTYQTDTSEEIATSFTADIIVTATQTNTTEETVVYAYTVEDINGAKTNQTVILMQDITEEDDVDLTTNVNFDLNGYTLTVDSFSMYTDDYCTVDIANGTIKTTTIDVQIPYGTVNLDNVTGIILEYGTVTIDASSSTLNLTGTTEFVDNNGDTVAITIMPDTRVVVDTEDDITLNIESGTTGVVVENAETNSGTTFITGDTSDTTVDGVDGDEYAIDLVGIAAGFDGGNGTEEYPFEVSNSTQLQLISSYRTYSFVQTTDITLDENFTQIGYLDGSKYYFTGSYDGGDYYIDGFTMSAFGSYSGLFAALYGATIENINLINIDLEVVSMYAGGIAGYAYNTTIDNCDVTGTIKITGNVSVSSTAVSAIGGIVGNVAGTTTISNCDVNADITDEFGCTVSSMGGIVGYNYSGTITISDCTFEGVIKGGSTSGYGGIAGQLMSGSITNCTTSGWVSGARIVGGIVGNDSANVTISGCTSDMDVYSTTTSSTACVGGIAGLGGSTITGCTVTGNIYTTYASTVSSKYIGEICGYGTQTDENTFSGTIYYSWDGTLPTY